MSKNSDHLYFCQGKGFVITEDNVNIVKNLIVRVIVLQKFYIERIYIEGFDF